MVANAKLRYIRVSPRKADQIIRLIRGMSVGYSLNILAHINKRLGVVIHKLLKSAVANAENKGIDTADLNNIYISKAVVNSGPVLKRYKSAPFGRAVTIRRRSSHIEIELDVTKQ